MVPSCSHTTFDLDDVDIYTWGLCYASVCVPKDMPRDEVEVLTNRKCPTGIESRWRISDEPNFQPDKNGNVSTNPCPCQKKPDTHIHYLLVC